MRLKTMKLWHSMRLLAAGLVCSVLAACSSGPQVRTDTDPSANFAAYRSFSFVEPLATSQAGYTTLLTERLKRATRAEMEARGYVFNPQNPDLLLNFHAMLQHRSDYLPPPVMPWGGDYYGYRMGYYGYWAGYPMGPQVIQYTEGVLNIDLVDARRKQLVWEGVGSQVINDLQKAASEQGVQNVVRAIFAKYPYRAGSGVNP